MNLLNIEFRSIIEITPLLTTFLSVLAVIIGWWYNQAKNRKNEIAKEARSYRIEMLRSFMNLVAEFEKNNTLAGIPSLNEYGEVDYNLPPTNLWAEIHTQIKMYGNNEEIVLYEQVMSVINDIIYSGEFCVTGKQFSSLVKEIDTFETVCINNIRAELNLKAKDLPK